MAGGTGLSEPHDPDNLLDRHSRPETLQVHYDQEYRRERALLARRLGRDGGDVLSVGCGWHPGRHLFPRPAWRMTGVDLNPAMLESDELDAGVAGRAGELGLPAGLFDVVLYRLVLHHIAYQGPLAPVLRRSGAAAAPRRRARGGGAGAVAPGRRGARAGQPGRARHAGPRHARRHPAVPARPGREARAAGLEPELHAVTFGWRRLPARRSVLCTRSTRSARGRARRGSVTR